MVRQARFTSPNRIKTRSFSSSARVFISYRREDSRATAGRLYDALRSELGSEFIFKDVDSIPKGADFRKELDHAISNTAIMLVVIGPGWMGKARDGRRRIEWHDDYVRMEVEQALGVGITVLPVLVDGGTIPFPELLPDSIRSLAFRNAASIDHDTWGRDLEPVVAIVRGRMNARAEKLRAEREIRRKDARRQELERLRTSAVARTIVGGTAILELSLVYFMAELPRRFHSLAYGGSRGGIDDWGDALVYWMFLAVGCAMAVAGVIWYLYNFWQEEELEFTLDWLILGLASGLALLVFLISMILSTGFVLYWTGDRFLGSAGPATISLWPELILIWLCLLLTWLVVPFIVLFGKAAVEENQL